MARKCSPYDYTPNLHSLPPILAHNAPPVGLHREEHALRIQYHACLRAVSPPSVTHCIQRQADHGAQRRAQLRLPLDRLVAARVVERGVHATIPGIQRARAASLCWAGGRRQRWTALPLCRLTSCVLHLQPRPRTPTSTSCRPSCSQAGCMAGTSSSVWSDVSRH